MECRVIKGISHCVYDTEEEWRSNENLTGATSPPHWHDKSVAEGDWVKSDDGRIVRILKKKPLTHWADGTNFVQNRYWVRTVVGSFHEHMYMDTDFARHPNRYSFGGSRSSNDPNTSDSPGVIQQERKFVSAFIATGDPYHAYQVVSKNRSKNLKYLHKRVSNLLKSPRVLGMIKEEVSIAAKTLGITPEYILGSLKEVADDQITPSKDKIAALKEMGSIIDIKPKQKSTRRGLMQSVRGVITPGEIERITGSSAAGSLEPGQQVAIDTIGIEETNYQSVDEPDYDYEEDS